MLLRRMVPGDGAAAEALSEEIRSRPDRPDGGFFLMGFPAAETDRWSREGGCGWLAEEEGRCQGFAARSPAGELLAAGPETWAYRTAEPHQGLEKLGVHERWRRKGLGSRLASLAARDAGTLLSSVVTAPVPNSASLAWHAAHGFVEIERYRGDHPGLPPGFASVLLGGSPLSPPPAFPHAEETRGGGTVEAADFVLSRWDDFGPLPSHLAGRSPESLRAEDLAGRHRPRARGWVFREAGLVRAAAILDDLGNELELAVVSVHPQSRGQGLGRALVSAARDHASRCGLPLVLCTSSGNAAACRTYEACGLRVEGRAPGDRTDGSDTLRFSWRP